MFFTPPTVKSLSKYSEFGSHLGSRNFLWMVGAVILLHILLIAAYSMKPREKTLIIPVRVLNIKLDGGGVFNPQPEPMPAMEQKPRITEERPAPGKIEYQREKPLTRTVADKTYSGGKQKPLIEILTQNTEKRKKSGEEAMLKEHDILLKPKKYVRTSEMNAANAAASAHAKSGGNGSGMAGTPGGRDIVRRYEQDISLWMAKHKIYPEEAKRERLEGSAVVRIRIDRTGHIVYSAIDVSSGNAVIDSAVIAMVRDSDPVPRVPDNYPTGRELEFLIPVSFRLQ